MLKLCHVIYPNKARVPFYDEKNLDDIMYSARKNKFLLTQ